MVNSSSHKKIDPRKKLIDNLFNSSEEMCPHIKRDISGEPYCGKGFKGGNISGERRLVCDVYSLQIFCLNGPDRHTICTYYQGESLD